jgi:hypothetical protein
VEKMKRKIICIGIISMFFMLGVATTYVAAKKIESSNQNPTLCEFDAYYEIEVSCEDNRILSLFPYFSPDEIDTTLTITNIDSGEIITEGINRYNDYIRLRQVYQIWLEAGGNYNIKCSIKLPDPMKPTEEYQEHDIYGLREWGSYVFSFDSEYKKPISKIHNVLSLFISQFPILQRLLNL